MIINKTYILRLHAVETEPTTSNVHTNILTELQRIIKNAPIMLNN